MDLNDLSPGTQSALEEVLGYVNFSAGAADERFQRNINQLFREIGSLDRGPKAVWLAVADLLKQKLAALRGTAGAFEKTEQGEAVLHLVYDCVLPAYRDFHVDLLFHQTDESLFQPFFVARTFETVLSEGAPWEEAQRITQATIARLNDFIGHRPVATLETAQKIQPYDHEWVRPVPLYIRGAGVAAGKYHDLIEHALEILNTTDFELLDQAYFDPALLDELAFDPRAYDFEHPAHRRPNYQFGQWDPSHLDNQGRYRRFVLVQVTMDALLQRCEENLDIPRDELIFEAAVVLAVTTLMASGTSGRGPDTHDSSTTLATLVPQIAAYRDDFYTRILAGMQGPHGDRLREEMDVRKQPFAGARQHLNGHLAQLRASQMEHTYLARLFAQMGYPEAAGRQAAEVPMASARMWCDLHCRIASGNHAIDRGELDQAADYLPEVVELLHRAIECGALVDPWNILGFQGHFSVFPSLENSIHDYRIEQLIRLMESIFNLYARLHSETAALGKQELGEKLLAGLTTLANWWDPFATMEMIGIQGVSGQETVDSARHVGNALAGWHQAGAAAGDIAFWREHVEHFDSPKAYALVIEAVMEKGDLVAAMGLLMQWLSQADEIALVDADYSFHLLAIRWMKTAQEGDSEVSSAKGWNLIRKFFDFLEASADEFWRVPTFPWGVELLDEMSVDEEEPSELEPDDEESELYSAAYEDMTFHDSALDGYEGELLDEGVISGDDEWDFEAQRLGERIEFLRTVARLWKMTAIHVASQPSGVAEYQTESFTGWFSQALEHRRQLLKLVDAVHEYPLESTDATREALIEYDRLRRLKGAVLERVVVTYVDMADSARMLASSLVEVTSRKKLADWEHHVVAVFRAAFFEDAEAVRSLIPDLLNRLSQRRLLYIPPADGGNPQQFAEAKSMQQVLRDLLAMMPRLGLVKVTCQLIDTARTMERRHTVGEGAITEFERLFQIGYRAIVETVIHATSPGDGSDTDNDEDLIDCLEAVSDPLVRRWVEHSRSLRLSVLEKVAVNARFEEISQFIQRYGRGLFTQKFLNLGNVRAILDQGVDIYLQQLDEDDDPMERINLLDDLDHTVRRDQAVENLQIILEAIVENYSDYDAYNTITTQSDRGDLLYTLLDVLRLKTSYERLDWQLKPIVVAHEVLARNGHAAAAEIWRRALAQRTCELADRHLARLNKLVQKHGMRLPTVADQLGDRFVRPLALDSLRALVKPAMEEARLGQFQGSFDRLEQGLAEFVNSPTAVGLDVPRWLTTLEDEVLAASELDRFHSDEEHGSNPIPQATTTLDDIRRQINDWREES